MAEQAAEALATRPLTFGLFDWLDRGDGELPDLYEQRLRMLEYADQAGYYCYHLAEHHGTPLGMAPAPSVFLAAVAQRTRRLRFGPLVYIVPLYHPIRLAEEICMLDQLSRGRLELGVGRGSSPLELTMLGLDVEQTRAIYAEAIDIVLTALTAGEVTFAGRYFHYERARLDLRPYQRPYPPLWYPTSNPDSIAWVAEQGYQLLLSFNAPTFAENERRLRVYREHFPRAQTNPRRVNPHVTAPFYGIVRKVYVADTDAEAHRVAREALVRFKENFTFLWSRVGPNRFEENLRDYEDCLARGVLFAGSPATVRERLGGFLQGIGANYFGAVFAWGHLRPEQVLRSMHLFTTEVVPALRNAPAPTAASG